MECVKSNKYDVIIIGAGLSGLSLALELAKKKNSSLLLIEEKKKYKRDRTWCFWEQSDHPFQEIVKKSWNSWALFYDAEKIVRKSSSYSYHAIAADSFYQRATAILKNCPLVTQLMGTQVLKLKESQDGVFVVTNQSTYFGGVVYDSRPHVKTVEEKKKLYQHFYGMEVTIDTPSFVEDRIILMDFKVDQKEGLNFIYLLPFSKTKALVESTFISSTILPLESYEIKIKEYLKERYSIDSYLIDYRERGVLPLYKVSEGFKKNKKIISIGQRGGFMRASTGYAFLEIQKGTKRLMRGIKRPFKKKIDDYLDHLFLSYLASEKREDGKIFFDLFKKNKPERLIRFLTGNWSFLDLVSVIASMPKFKMIKQVFK